MQEELGVGAASNQHVAATRDNGMEPVSEELGEDPGVA